MRTASTSRRLSRSSRAGVAAVAVLGAAAVHAGLASAVRFSAADGLPSEPVTVIAPDGLGRLWAGTDAGLRMLVGDAFVVEASATADGFASPVYGETIRDIAAAPSGEVWVATASVLFRRSAEGAWVEGEGADVGLVDGVAGVLVTPAGEVWAGGQNAGLFRRAGGAWEPRGRGLLVFRLAIDGAGVVWAAGFRDGAVLVRDPGGPAQQILHFGAGGLPAGSPQALEGDKGGVWVGTNNGLAFVASDGAVSGQHDAADLPSANVLSLAPAGAGEVWVGTAGGLARVGAGGVDADAGAAAGLSGRTIESLAVDRAGDVWAGTSTGIVKVPVRSWVLEPAPLDGYVSAVGHTSAGTGFAVSDGILYVAGAARWAAVTGLEDRQIVEVAPDRSGGILVGTDAGWGTARNGAFTPDDRCCIGGQVSELYEDDAGRTWVGTKTGVTIVDEAGTIKTFRKSDDEIGLGQDPVADIFPGSDGTVWVGTVNGGATPFTNLVPGLRITRAGTGGGLSSDLVGVGLVTSTGDVWLGTELGLNRGKGGAWTAQRGALGGDITALVDSGSGQVWVGTEAAGLVLIDCTIPFDGGCATSTFGEADGLSGPEVTALSAHGGELWIGTSGGLTRHLLDTRAPTVTLGRVQPVQSEAGDYLELRPRDRLVDDRSCYPCLAPMAFDTKQVAIGIVATDVEDPQGTRFLVGSEVGPQQLVGGEVFSRLVEPGRVYETTVTAIDRHFNRSEPARMTFAIEATPFYREGWFLVLAPATALMAAFAALIWWLGRDRLGYRDALVSFRAVDDTVEARLRVDGMETTWQPVAPVLARLDEMHERLRADASVDPRDIAAAAEEVYRSVAGDADRARALGVGRPVRLGLDLSATAGLERLPWEVMHLGPGAPTEPPREDAPGTGATRPGAAAAEAGERSTDGRLALVRRVGTGTPTSPTRRAPGIRWLARLRGRRLRVLVAWAKPRDRAFVAAGEYEAIERIARQSGGRLEVIPMSLVQRDRLAAELDQDLDVFHFIGHGEMRPGGPVLLFEDEDGRAHAATLKQLSDHLGRQQGRTRRPRLVILSACQSADEAADQPASGLAAGLVREGVVPAAIGMGYLFHMQSASRFSASFYESLLRFGQIEHAAATARRAVRLSAVDKEDWLVPRLYARELGAGTFEVIGGRR